MNNDVLFSSKTDNWATPPEVFKDLDNEFKFTLDPCASKENHECDKYFTKEGNGLLQDWGGSAYTAIRHMAEQLATGLRKRRKSQGKKTQQ